MAITNTANNLAAIARIKRKLAPNITLSKTLGRPDVLHVVRNGSANPIETVQVSDLDDLESRLDRGRYVLSDGTLVRDFDLSQLSPRELADHLAATKK